jgi:hypothetical protein
MFVTYKKAPIKPHVPPPNKKSISPSKGISPTQKKKIYVKAAPMQKPQTTISKTEAPKSSLIKPEI